MSEWTMDAALTVLTALQQNIPWNQPIRETQSEALRAVAVYLRDTLDAEQNPPMDDLALIGALDSLLEWLVDPEDEHRINRFRRAHEIYSDFYDMVDELP